MTKALGTFEDGKVKGMMAPLYEMTFDILRAMGNITMDAVEHMGDLIDSQRMLYDGCIGRLQNNLSDILMPMMVHPILGPGLIHGHPMWWQRTMITASYNKSNTGDIHTDVMEVFELFDLGVWAMTAFTFACFLVTIPLILFLNKSLIFLRRNKILKLRSMIKPSVSLTWQIILGNVLHQNSSYEVRNNKFPFRFQLLLLVIYSFLVSFYFTSMIKTDMVVQKTPDTVSSYQEIIDRPDINPYWYRGLREHVEFEQAEPDSPMGQIWQRAVRRGINQSRFEGDQESVMKIMGEFRAQKAVCLLPGYSEQSCLTNVCGAFKMLGYTSDIHLWIRYDDSAQERHTGLMISSHMKPGNLHKLQSILKAVMEEGLNHMLIKNMEYFFAKDKYVPEVRDCASNKIIYPDSHNILAPGIPHFRLLFVTIVGFLLVATIMFWFEFIR